MEQQGYHTKVDAIGRVEVRDGHTNHIVQIALARHTETVPARDYSMRSINESLLGSQVFSKILPTRVKLDLVRSAGADTYRTKASLWVSLQWTDCLRIESPKQADQIDEDGSFRQAVHLIS